MIHVEGTPFFNVCTNPSGIKSQGPAPHLKTRLMERGIIDDHYNCLCQVSTVSLNEVVKKRLKDLFLNPIKIAGEIFPLRDVLQAIFVEVNKLSCGQVLKPQLRGSKVLDVLGKEYASDLFRSVGVELTEEELQKFQNTKKSFDLDLGVWVNAGFHEREAILSSVESALFSLLRPRSSLNDRELREALFLEKPANIVDDQSRYLNTSIGTDDFHVEILWIESFSRGEIFLKDARSINLPNDFLDDLGEPEVHSSENILKPFIDLLFDLLTVFNPDTVNKRGLGRLFLEEAQGKKLLDPFLEEKFYYIALLKCPKGKSIAKYFYELMEFCNRKHAREDGAFFILYLKMGALLTLKIGSKDLASITSKDLEEYKRLLPKNLRFENELFQIVYDYCLRPDTQFADCLCLVSLIEKRISPREKGFILNLQAPLKKIPLPRCSESRQGLKVLIALYEAIPSLELKMEILTHLPLDISGFDLPLLGLKEDFFAKVHHIEKSYPKEGYLRAFLSDSTHFQAGLQMLEPSQLRTIFPWLIAVHPVNAFRIYRALKTKWSDEDRKKALNLFVKHLPKCSMEESLKFPFEEWALEVEAVGLKPENLALADISSLIQNPVLRASLSPYLFQDRLVEEGKIALFVDLIAYTPLDKVEALASRLSFEKLHLIFSSKEIKGSETLGRLARVYLQKPIPKAHFFRLIFFFRLTAEQLTPPLYQRVTEEAAQQLDMLHESRKELKNPPEEVAVAVGSAPDCSAYLCVKMLEMGIILSPEGVDKVIPNILKSSNAFFFRKIWGWIVRSSLAEMFLVKALDYESLKESALLELQDREASSDYFLSISRSLLAKKAFIPLFMFIRDHERQMKGHPEWRAFLIEAYSTWLDAKRDVDVIREGFVTFISLSTPFDDYLLHVLWKVDEADDPNFKRRIISYLLSHYTLENLFLKEKLLNLLLKNLAALSPEELAKYDSHVLKIGSFKLSKSQIDLLMQILVHRKVTSSDHFLFPLILRFKESPHFKALFRDLAFFSKEDSLFEEALKSSLEIGFPADYDRLAVFTRLLKMGSNETLRFLQSTRGWSFDEIRHVFKILSLQDEYFDLFEDAMEGSFFYPISRDPKNYDLIKEYVLSFDCGGDLVILAGRPFFKGYFSYHEGYQVLLDRMKQACEIGDTLLLEEFLKVDLRKEDTLWLVTTLFKTPQTHLRRLADFFRNSEEDLQDLLLKELYELCKKEPHYIKRFIGLMLHPRFLAFHYKEMDWAILRLMSDQDPTLFEETFKAYLNHFALALFFETEGKPCDKDTLYKRPRDLEELLIFTNHVTIGDDYPGYQVKGASVKTYYPLVQCKFNVDIVDFILDFTRSVIFELQRHPEIENRYLRDFVFHQLLTLIVQTKSWSHKFEECLSDFIESYGSTQEIYEQHLKLCTILHNKASEIKEYRHTLKDYITLMLGIKPETLIGLKVKVQQIGVALLRDRKRVPVNIHMHLQHVLKVVLSQNLVDNTSFDNQMTFVYRLKKHLLDHDVLDKTIYTYSHVFEAVLPRMSKDFMSDYSCFIIKSAHKCCSELCQKYPQKTLIILLAFYRAAILHDYLSSSGFEIIQEIQLRIVDALAALEEKEEVSRIKGYLFEIVEASSSPRAKKLKIDLINEFKSDLI